jgi:biotin transport system substrate-specific component
MTTEAMQRPQQALIPSLVPNTGLARDAMLVLGGSLFVAALAQVQIPLQPVPITGQTLGVFLVALALGARLGSLAIGLYLLEAAMGLPVLAGFSGGLAKFAGPTGGFLVGFLIASGVVGWLADRGWTRHALMVAAAMLIGTVVIYVPGLLWLSKFTGEKTFELGLIPFIPGDAIKAALAAVLLPSAWKLTRR